MGEPIGMERHENRAADRKQAETDPGGEQGREIEHLQRDFLRLRRGQPVDDAPEQEGFGELRGSDGEVGDRQQDGEGCLRRQLGENPSVAEVSGINVARTRYMCVIVGGMLMGFAGAVYSLDYNPVWNYNFLMGWGFIALALVFFSLWNPWILLGGSLLFGFLWQLSLNPQLFLPGVFSRYIWRTVPFVITLLVLLVMSTKWFRAKWGSAKPEALGEPYVKG